jgi:Kef-type K+ transport system membrane component KefB
MVIVFCIILILGIVGGQVIDLAGYRDILSLITSICLSYIMIEVGLAFSVDNKKVSSYGWDFVVAFSAAVLPALLWLVYFMAVLSSPWQPALLAGLSSAPTSAGVLFSLLMAAGLTATWVFQKARTLAVLDDLVVIMLLIPLEILMHGFNWRSISVVVLITGFLFASFRFRNRLNWPVSQTWLLAYGTALTILVFVIKNTVHIHLEVLLPAFMLGCLIKHQSAHAHEKPAGIDLDVFLKGLFMFLVGLSFPKITMGNVPLGVTLGHILVLTVLANLGKCFPMLCYRKEAPVKERLALSIAMFPRGEVGAAVLLISLGYGFGGYVTSLAMLSLGFNLILTGGFVWLVIRLLRKS